MPTIDYTTNRINALLNEIDQLKQSEFPYAHPRDALDLLEKRFRHHLNLLQRIPSTAPASVIHNQCSVSLYDLHIFTPILGFILRSTNVRNAFEVYDPLLRLARTILVADTKLILSSEWEYSPYVYRSMTHMRGFVLIGLPAPESSNPLLIPLAGHELGHSAWETWRLSSGFELGIENAVLKEITTKRWKDYHALYPQYTKADLSRDHLFTPLTWMPAYTWALLQIEEIFCDFFGLRLFSESYLHAFEYLISPGTPGQRSVRYPNITSRVSHLTKAAQEMKVVISPQFESSFMPETEPPEPSTKLLVSIADTVSTSLVPDLIELAKKFATDRSVPERDEEEVSKISDEIRHRVAPTSSSQSLTDILNAGWECFLDKELWKEVKQIGDENRYRVLQDIILKSMEVSEVQERVRE